MQKNDIYVFDYLLVKSPDGELFRLYNVENLPEGYEICDEREHYTWEGYLKEKYCALPRADLDLGL